MFTPQTYRKKPVEIQALQWTGDNIEEMMTFVSDDSLFFSMDDDDKIEDLYITTLEGDMKANVGDYIIKGLKGEFYPCSEEIFVMSYDKVELNLDVESHTHALG